MKTLRDVPAVPGSPLIGNLIPFRRDPLGLMRTAADTGEPLVRLQLGPVQVLVVLSAEHAEEVLVRNAEAFVKSRGLGVVARPLLGNGLLTAEHGQHKRQRRLMAPAFAHKRIAGYAEVMAALGEREQARWVDGAVIDVSREMMRTTLAIVGKTLFDAELAGDAGDVGAAMDVALRHVIYKAVRPLSAPYGVPTPANLRYRRAIAALDEIVYRVIAERRASGEDRGDVLSMLLAARDEDDGSGMDDRQVRDEVMTLFLAGHETTANALSWSFLQLAEHPEAYARLAGEAEEALGGRLPRYEDLARLPYALRVLKESMRLHPPAYMIGRKADRAVEIGGYQIPAGTITIVATHAIHRRADYWPEPERFDPDRFLDGAERARPRFAWLPFGGGPRICIGNHFALMEGQLLLAHLAQRVRFERVDAQPIAPEPLVTLRPRGGLPMRVRRREAPAIAAA